MPTYPDELMIGTYTGGVAGMVAISSLGEGSYASAIQEGSFSSDPMSYSIVVTLGDGTEQEQGYQKTEWHINGLRASQYDAIEAYKINHTTQLYIRTLKNDGETYANYLVNAIFPVKPNRGDPTAVEGPPTFDYLIRFIQAVEQV